jgi:hypothetical protein
MSRTYKKNIKYRKTRSFACNNHGSCSYCESNRTIQTKKVEEKAKQEFALFGDEEWDGWDLLGSDAY